jgi:hypothetical protein
VKVWFGYGSEHSANLVMIGHFADATQAKAVAATIERIEHYVRDELNAGRMELGREGGYRFTDQLLALLEEIKLYSIGPVDIENFAYEYSITVKGSDVILKTDEVDVSGFLKVMIDGGAKVEVYSAHNYPDEEVRPAESKD